MDKDILEQISALLAHARNLVDEMDSRFDLDDEDVDIVENWLYQIENIENDIDGILGQFQ